MRELHLFAGAGGGILGGMLLGHTCVCAVEIEPYCREVLLQRQRDGILPRFPIWDDVRTFDGGPWRGLVDVVCGGFSCTEINGLRWAGVDKNEQERCSDLDCKNFGPWRDLQNKLQIPMGIAYDTPIRGVLRNDDGLDVGMDRVKAIGNGQVPSVVKLAWETLSL